MSNCSDYMWLVRQCDGKLAFVPEYLSCCHMKYDITAVNVLKCYGQGVLPCYHMKYGITDPLGVFADLICHFDRIKGRSHGYYMVAMIGKKFVSLSVG